jgi:flagellar basal body-associated protein FliL
VRRVLPFIAVAVISLALGAGATWFLKPSAGQPAEANGDVQTQEAAPTATHEDVAAPTAYTYAIKDRVVSLADPGARRYLKASVVLELAASAPKGSTPKSPPSAEEQKKLADAFGKQHGSLVQDVLTTLLSARRADEVLQPAGRERLREEIRARLNDLLPADERVARVLITDFLVQ